MKKTGYVFPGQGSQFVGMLIELAQQYPVITTAFSMVSDRLGYDVWALVQTGPAEQLNQTEHTQVAMLTADVALFRLLVQQGVAFPNYLAGHSLGEYAALVCAEAITLTDAAALVAARGRLMQETIPFGQGAMAAVVGLTNEQVEAICAQVSLATDQVVPANYNAIGQVVIAGHTRAVARAMALADEQGARLTTIIPVSVPCHCPLLETAAELFSEHLQATSFHCPKIPVFSNVDVSVYTSVEQIKFLLKEQLYRPVRWVETIQAMKRLGVERIVECGPGKVLTGLIKRIDKSLQTVTAQDEIREVQHG